MQFNDSEFSQSQEYVWVADILLAYPHLKGRLLVVSEFFKAQTGKGFMLVGNRVLGDDAIDDGIDFGDCLVADFAWSNSPLGKTLAKALSEGNVEDTVLGLVLLPGKKPSVKVIPNAKGNYYCEGVDGVPHMVLTDLEFAPSRPVKKLSTKAKDATVNS